MGTNASYFDFCSNITIILTACIFNKSVGHFTPELDAIFVRRFSEPLKKPLTNDFFSLILIFTCRVFPHAAKKVLNADYFSTFIIQ